MRWSWDLCSMSINFLRVYDGLSSLSGNFEGFSWKFFMSNFLPLPGWIWLRLNKSSSGYLFIGSSKSYSISKLWCSNTSNNNSIISKYPQIFLYSVISSFTVFYTLLFDRSFSWRNSNYLHLKTWVRNSDCDPGFNHFFKYMASGILHFCPSFFIFSMASSWHRSVLRMKILVLVDQNG